MCIEHAARAFAQARDRYHDCFRQYFDQRVQPLSDDRFWQLQSVFRDEIRSFRFVMNRSDGVARAADEFFRNPYTGHFSDRNGRALPRYSLDEAMQFAKTWGEIVDRLYPVLFSVVTNRSDDTYGDLIDSLSLLGREVLEQAVEGKFTKMSQLLRAARARCKELSLPPAFVLEGENYVGSCLYESAMDYFAHRVADASA
jgi:hypothetical protein